jgi:beta-glucosidase
VNVLLEPEAFQYYDPDRRTWLLEPGEFEVLVGASATDIRQRARCTVGGL